MKKDIRVAPEPIIVDPTNPIMSASETKNKTYSDIQKKAQEINLAPFLYTKYFLRIFEH